MINADIQVIQENDKWLVELTHKDSGFKAREVLPAYFPNFNEEQKAYWCKKIFKKLEKKLHQRITSIKTFTWKQKLQTAHPPAEALDATPAS